MDFTKVHPNISKIIRFFVIFGFFDQFAILNWIGLDFNTPSDKYIFLLHWY
jgi:hypothetical protein